MWNYNADHPLRHYFSGLTEQTFMADLGVADPPLIDYLSMLLSRFVHIDSIYKLRSGAGKRLEEVADMLMEVEAMPPEGRTSREVHRHIGDFTLFWTGVYPEVLKRLHSPVARTISSTTASRANARTTSRAPSRTSPFKEEATVLRRLSERFELCAFGLTKVRDEWERKPARLIALAV